MPPTKKDAARKPHPLTQRVLREAATKATSQANRRAFAHVKTLLIAQDGWLVRVDRDGKVVERVKALSDASVGLPSSGTDG